MNSALRLVLLVALLAGAAWITRRRDDPARPVPRLWGFWSNLGRSLAGWNALAGVVAVLLTFVFVRAGWDRWLQDLWQREDPLGHALPRAVLRYGEWWTPGIAVALLTMAWIRGDRWRLAGSVALQAVLAGLVLTLTLKLLTGRRGPASPDAPQPPPFPKGEDAGDFAFDAWRRTFEDGRFFWPSGHTLSSMALVSALAAAFPDHRWIAWLGYALVAFVAVAMVDGDFHWTSDVLAAVLLGQALGRTVGTRLAAEHARRAIAVP